MDISTGGILIYTRFEKKRTLIVVSLCRFLENAQPQGLSPAYSFRIHIQQLLTKKRRNKKGIKTLDYITRLPITRQHANNDGSSLTHPLSKQTESQRNTNIRHSCQQACMHGISQASRKERRRGWRGGCRSDCSATVGRGRRES